jgi:hypothetical protein
MGASVADGLADPAPRQREPVVGAEDVGELGPKGHARPLAAPNRGLTARWTVSARPSSARQ